MPIFLLFLLLFGFWRAIKPAQRQEIHRISKISAVTLIGASLIALAWHLLH